MSLEITITDLLTAVSSAESYDAVVSLVDPGITQSAFTRPPIGPWLFLQCLDVDEPMEQGPSTSEVRSLLDFYEAIKERIDSRNVTLLFHCHAGVSRSPAAAIILLARHLGPGRELEAAREIFRLRSIACPNRALLQAGDRLLGCGGALVAAVEAAEQESTDDWSAFRPASLKSED